ncbi:MAG: TlpA family protein disulfide reductase [Thermoanaerobaculia bacterium]|nr:MAG: TlpA family protein disulfide reductase [Thermoanaerobaculia bacterium]MBZ0102951.1 TlpA family protein disulfide reductase [Thermoanaerobaculia bacterium]
MRIELRRAWSRWPVWAIAAALLLASPAMPQADVRLPGLDGGQLTGADLARGPVVILVWASWSPRCRDIVARANAVAAKFGGEARIVTVNFQEDVSTIREFLAGQKLSVPVFLDRDGAFSKAHAVTALPGLIVFRDGQARYTGKLPADLDATLRNLLD